MVLIKQFLYRYPFLAYLLLAGIVFWPISLGIYSLQFDAIDVFLPWRFFGSESIRQGMVPLWNPYQSGGYPFFADLQYSIWNPELFIVSLFTRYNATTVQLLYLFYIAIGGLGFRYLLKQFDLEKKIAFFGGILFMLSGILIGHAQSISSVLGAIWLPWAIGSYIVVLKNNFTFRETVSFILFLFLMLSSGYQAVSIMLFYLLLTFFICRLFILIKAKNAKGIKRCLFGHLIVALSIGALMSGVVFSLIDVFPHLSRFGGVSLEDTQRFIMHPKALISLLFPLASVQESIPNMDVSFQNIFNGTLILFFLIFGLKNYKKHHSPYLIILTVIGIVYAFASFGGLTPVQPFLAKYLPGFNLFFYPVFYRYFTWIFILIIASFGFKHYLELKKPHFFLYFLLVGFLVYLLACLYTISSLNAMFSKVNIGWGFAMRTFSFNEAILFESLIHLAIIVSFILVYLFVTQKEKLIFLFLIVELGLIAQLNIPITVHGEGKTATINNVIDSKREGFFSPNNLVSMKEYETNGSQVGVWRNQGNFTNLPNLKGFTSFELNARINTIDSFPNIEQKIEAKPLAYLKESIAPVIIEKFTPQHFIFNVITPSADKLVVQQASYPGWEAYVNGSLVDISLENIFEMSVPLKAGENQIEFRFKKPIISFLFYFTSLSFIGLLLLYFWISDTPLTALIKCLIIGGVIFFVGFKLINFQFKSEALNQKRITVENELDIVLKSNLSRNEKEEILEKVMRSKSKSISIINEGLDLDPELLAVLNYKYSKIVKPISSSSKKITLSLSDKITDNQQIILDSSNRFASPNFHQSINDLYKKNNIFTCGLTIHSENVPENVFIVVEIKRGLESIYYKGIPVEYFKTSYSNYFMSGFIMPTIEKEDCVRIYLWNNSSKEFVFSRFNVKVLTLD